MAQANAQVGIATAAFFPAVDAERLGGRRSPVDRELVDLACPVLVGGSGSLAETLFDAGSRRATVQQYQAAFNAAVASYRGSVLAAFQQVEDSLSALRILSAERATGWRRDVRGKKSPARHARYTAGVDPYLNVITAQTTLLANQQAAITFG